MATVDGVSTESVHVAKHEESDPIHPNTKSTAWVTEVFRKAAS